MSYRSRKFSVSGFYVFSGNGDIFRNLFRSKHLNKFSPQNLCRLRHFRDSEKRLPCGIRTGDLRRRSGKNSRFFQKSGANLHPCLAITPIEGAGCQLFFIFFEKKSVFLWSFAEKTWIKGMRDCGAIIGGWRCRAPARMVDPEKILFFFQKTGANLLPCLALTPIERSCAKAEKSRFFRKNAVFYWSFAEKFWI